jgi:hypothetical protein
MVGSPGGITIPTKKNSFAVLLFVNRFFDTYICCIVLREALFVQTKALPAFD